MIYQKIRLKELYPNLANDPTVVTYIPDQLFPDHPIARQTVIICPGGAYAYTSEREAECIATSYVARGKNAVVLYYSCQQPQHAFPQQLAELCATVDLVRHHTEDWWALPDQVYVCGFSAGGHLAASGITLWHLPEVAQILGVTAEAIRPDGAILCYPVISSDLTIAHQESIKNLLGVRQEDPTLWKLASLEEQVTAQTPPAFLWHTFADGAVPVENSLRFATALKQNGVPFELHVYPRGHHGLSLARPCVGVSDQFPEVREWMNLSLEWLDRQLAAKNG